MFTVGSRSYANEDEAQVRIEQIDAENRDAFIDPESPTGQEWNALNKFVEQMRGRRRRLAELAKDPSRHERTYDPDGGSAGGLSDSEGSRGHTGS